MRRSVLNVVVGILVASAGQVSAKVPDRPLHDKLAGAQKTLADMEARIEGEARARSNAEIEVAQNHHRWGDWHNWANHHH
jgi:hypothetical protein